MIFETGRVCLKIAGREAGKYCVVVQSVDASFVMVSGPKTITRIKRRKCSVLHLEPIDAKLNVSENATDEALENAWKASGLIEKLNIELPRKKTPKAESVKKTAKKN